MNHEKEAEMFQHSTASNIQLRNSMYNPRYYSMTRSIKALSMLLPALEPSNIAKRQLEESMNARKQKIPLSKLEVVPRFFSHLHVRILRKQHT